MLTRLAVAEDADLLAAPHLHLLDGHPAPDVDPLAGEHAGHVAGDFGVLAREHAILIGEHRHLRAESREDLGELQADRTGADDDQAVGNARQRPERRAVEVPRVGKTGNRRPGRSRARRHDEPASLDPRSTVDHHRVVGVEGRGAVIDVDAPAAKGLVRFTRRARRRQPPKPAHHLGEIHMGQSGLDPHIPGLPDLANQPSRLDQSLAGDARLEPALALRPPLVDQGNLRPHPCRRDGRVQPPGSATDHHKVIHRRCLDS